MPIIVDGSFSPQSPATLQRKGPAIGDRLAKAQAENLVADERSVCRLAKREFAGEMLGDADVKALAAALRNLGKGTQYFESKVAALRECQSAKSIVDSHTSAIAAHEQAQAAADAHANAPEHAPILLRAQQLGEVVAAALQKKNAIAAHVEPARQLLIRHADLLND